MSGTQQCFALNHQIKISVPSQLTSLHRAGIEHIYTQLKTIRVSLTQHSSVRGDKSLVDHIFLTSKYNHSSIQTTS